LGDGLTSSHNKKFTSLNFTPGLGKPKCRWEDNIKIGLLEIEGSGVGKKGGL
jgi:hypothetical protein